MDIFILGLTCLVNLLLGLIVVLRKKNGAVEISFAAITVFVIVWIVANYFANTSGLSLPITDFANRLAYVAPLCVLATSLVFSYVFPQKRSVTKPELLILVIGFTLMSLLAPTDFVAGNVHYASNKEVVFTVGSLTWAYGLFAVLCLVLIARNLIQLPKEVDERRKAQAHYILFSMSTSVLLVLVMNLVVPSLIGDWSSTRFGPLATIIFVTTIAYSIVKHRLFDIKLAVVRTVAYSLALASLSAIYYVMAYLVSLMLFNGETSTAVSISPVNVFLALALAFIFQPIKHFFDRITNSIFYHDVYKSEKFFAEFSELLASTTDLRGLLERASGEIATTLKAEQCFFFLYYSNSVRHHMSSGTSQHSRLPFADATTLDEFVAQKGDRIILTDNLPEEHAIRRMLVSHRIALVLPLIHKSRIIGYVCLGDQLSSGYTKRDIGVLDTISNELVIAIQNALSVHEVREINATLEQRIKVATAELRESNAQLHRLDTAKDEFVSMASHQLRTPLTSVKGYISMMLDGDVGKISETQRNALKEAFNSSERMVRLISDFLSVSRLQTGKFVIEKKPTDLVKVIEQEVDGLRIIASTHGQKLTYVHPRHLPEISLDEPKIRQVVMNFIDNAIYYSRADSTIHISLSKLNEEIAFTVEDTGIGVPRDEQHKLFSKFYRASNARQQRPDGTGVGLYLAKKIITAHDGKPIFSSVEGQGSTFGFRIPLMQKLTNPDDQKNDHK